jgi:hypothetical protein
MGYSIRPHILPHKYGVFRPSAHLPHMGYSVRPHILPHFMHKNMGYLVRPPILPHFMLKNMGERVREVKKYFIESKKIGDKSYGNYQN